MFSAVAEPNFQHAQADEASDAVCEAPEAGSEVELLALLAQAANDNARRS